MTRVKICGLTRVEDVEKAIELGADALGFVFEESSPRYSKGHIDLVLSLGPYVLTVAVFGRLYQAVFETSGCKVAQYEAPDPWASTGAASVITIRLEPDWTPEIAISAVRKAEKQLDETDALLLDAYHPELGGGTGQRIDWDLASFLVDSLRAPVILAGGLTQDNVAQAIQKVRPYAVDVSSGVESSPGVKDHIKMRDFIQAAKGAC